MPIKIQDTNFFDIHEVAETYGVSTRTLKRYLNAGKLEGNRLGRTWYFTEGSIKNYFEGKQGVKDGQQ